MTTNQRRREQKIFCWAAFGIVLIVTGSSASDLDTIGVTQLHSKDPSLIGTGVRVGLAESEPATNAWQVNPAAIGQPVSLFTYFSADGSTNTFPNALGLESFHADQVASLYFGSSISPAPGVEHVENYQADYFYEQVILNPSPTAIASQVINQSFIFSEDPSAEQKGVDRSYDDYIAQFGTVMVSGAGNGGTVSPPSTAYNGMSVGAFGGASSTGPTADNGRAKPDLVAPAGFTSFSTPLVAGCAAILLQAGARGDGGPGTATDGTDARTIKALLLNGAVKPADWVQANGAPLDFRYGAGVLNVFNAYQQLQAGKQPFMLATTNPLGEAHLPPATTGAVPGLRGWDFNSISSTLETDGVNHYFIELPGPAHRRFNSTATLVWHRPKSSPATNELNDLDLFVFNVTNNTLVASSQSQVDNVEHVFPKSLPPGRYDLQVLKNGGLMKSVTDTENYALAFEFVGATSPNFVNVVVANDQFQARLLGEPNQIYVVQASSDFVNWTAVATNVTSAQGFFDFTETLSTGNRSRFYRAVTQ